MNEEFKQTQVGSRRDPESIRQEIRRTRGEMDGTVDELVDRLSVGNLVDEVWQRFRHRSGNLDGVLKDHPIPLALIGLGLGWLLVEQAKGGSSDSQDRENGHGSGLRGRGQARHAAGYAGSPGSTWQEDMDDESHEGIRDRMGEKASNVKHRAADLNEQVADRASELKDDLSDTASDLTHRVGDTVSSVKESASHLKDSGRDAGRRAQQSMKSMFTDHPLTAGGIAFGLGLASGLAVPSTSFEDRKLGEMSERLKEQARSVGRQAAATAGEVGQTAAHAVVEEVHDRLEDDESGDQSDPAQGRDEDAGGVVGDASSPAKGGGPGAPRASL